MIAFTASPPPRKGTRTQSAPRSFFSASSSGGLAGVALARDQDLGLDVERLRPVPDLDLMARSTMTPEEQEFEIDYLGERATQKVYLYFDKHPRDLRVEAHPKSYRLE